MSILIKGMVMPEKCGKCRFFAWSRGVGQHCAVASDITFHATLDGFDVGYERNGDCPLIEIPKHGRLIDADALKEDWKNGFYKKIVDALMDDAPTVIPAEEGE